MKRIADSVVRRFYFSSPLALYTLAIAFVFTLGFFIHFGREAHASKSWNYVISDSDELFYWSIAKGRTMSPRCDGNPYYYEEQGTRHIIPSTTSEVIGLLSKYTRVPLSWFFPAWEILMPLFLWWGVTLCCWKLWNYPLNISAAGTAVILLLTLSFPFPIPILFRFTRNTDAIVPVFLWLSLIFKGDPGNKKHCALIIVVSALSLWLQPLNACFGLWITGIEYLHSLLKGKKVLELRLQLCAIGSCLVSGLIYVGYAYYGKDTVSVLLDNSAIPPPAAHVILMAVSAFFVAASIVFFFRVRLGREITCLDRFVLEWTLFGIICYFAAIKMIGARHVPGHLGYFFVPMMFSVAGWIHEKLCILKDTRYFSRFSNALILLSVLVIFIPVVTHKRILLAVNYSYSAYIGQFFFVFLIVFWVFKIFPVLRAWIARKEIISGIILILALWGFWNYPIFSANRDFPFHGGYQWLRRHALKNEVVLTASLKHRMCEYLFIKTGLKSYFYIHGGSEVAASQALRRSFVTGLLLGQLDRMPFHEGESLDQKIQLFRLDYILIPKPSPFYDAITHQLNGHLQEVYHDRNCLIWRVL